MLCDKHVNSQLRESAQMLCAAFPPETNPPMKRTHYNHPCTKWARDNFQNWMWLLQHGFAIAMEFVLRYSRDHQCSHYIDWCARNRHRLYLPDGELTEFALAMPEKYKVEGNAVASYRAYYLGEKASFATWTVRQTPAWWLRAQIT